ncbi:low specificity L-threonine aldolase [Acidisphaera sp. S103]|uniref:threonine aldolase family protein n=1 Tax=Acidisphaera sp. S103 TaxID=1747223 RepID=UPI00131E332F|nr:beta-eliminating lyase-related protein [Acidisphaera sp. S103]
MNTIGRNFGSDNVTPASPEVIDAIVAANVGSLQSYGDDPYTHRLTTLASTLFETEVTIYPVATGTVANALALSVLTPPYGAIYCHEAAHIMTDECGAPEFYTGGAKIIGLPTADGKIVPAQLDNPLRFAQDTGVHHVRPATLSLTQSTEWGTVYTPAEVSALSDAAHAYGLGVHMDGSRLANAIACLGCSPAEITWKSGVDALCLGATKNGAMAAEAVVFFDRTRAAGFESRRKRAGHLWSKMRFLSAQLIAYLEDGLWLRNARHANAMAARLAAGLTALSGIQLVQPVQANELFVVMPEAMIATLLAEGFEFHRWPAPAGVSGSVVRLVTAFCTTAADVDALLAAISDRATR